VEARRAQAGPGVFDGERSRATAMRTVPPTGVTRSAFSIRFDATWSSRSWSPSAGAAPLDTYSNLNVERLRLGLKTLKRLAGDFVEIYLCTMDTELTLTHACKVEQIADQSLQAKRLFSYRVGNFTGCDRAVGERFRIAAHRRKRGSQLVADRE